MSYSREELEEAGLLDFRMFLIQVWAFLNLPDPTPVQMDIAKRLQHAPRRYILQAFRGIGKSWITVAFVLWNLLLNPQMKIKVVSANQQLADSLSIFAKQLINGMEILQHLRSREGQRDSSISFDVGPADPAKDPSVQSIGITGQLTGTRADLIIADDIEVPKNSQTHTLRERLAELVKEFDALLKPGGRVIYLGTPQIEDSLYNKLAKDRGYTIEIWPAEIPKDASRYHGRLATFVQQRIDAGWPVGAPLDPKRFDRQDLDERHLSYRDAGYALQFMLDTNPSDADRYPLKLGNLLVMDVDNEMAPVKVIWGRENNVVQDLASGGLDGDLYRTPTYRSPEMCKFQGCVMAVDPSGKGTDETAFAIVKYVHGQLYLVDAGGFVDGFGEQTLKLLAARAGRWGVTDYIDESNYGGGMFTALITPHLHKFGITRINPEEHKAWSTGVKENRILDTLEPIFANHRLVVHRGVIEDDIKVQVETPSYSLVQQITRMSRVKGELRHDDRVDALEMACRFWTNRMDRDQKLSYEKHKEGLLDAELRKFMKHAFNGGRATGPHKPKYARTR